MRIILNIPPLQKNPPKESLIHYRGRSSRYFPWLQRSNYEKLLLRLNRRSNWLSDSNHKSYTNHEIHFQRNDDKSIFLKSLDFPSMFQIVFILHYERYLSSHFDFFFSHTYGVKNFSRGGKKLFKYSQLNFPIQDEPLEIKTRHLHFIIDFPLTHVWRTYNH